MTCSVVNPLGSLAARGGWTVPDPVSADLQGLPKIMSQSDLIGQCGKSASQEAPRFTLTAQSDETAFAECSGITCETGSTLIGLESSLNGSSRPDKLWPLGLQPTIASSPPKERERCFGVQRAGAARYRARSHTVPVDVGPVTAAFLQIAPGESQGAWVSFDHPLSRRASYTA